MADTNPIELEWRLRTTSDNEGLRQHTEATKLDTAAIREQKAAMAESSGGYGLATEGKDVFAVESKKAYTVATEAEYVALQKSLLAAQAKLPVMQALGVSTDKLTLDIAALDAALSTESALNVADKLEQDALAAAKLKQAAAAEAAAIAEGEEAGAHQMNAMAMRESLILERELASGNLARTPYSATMLLSRLGVSIPQVMALAAAGMAVAEVWKLWNKNEKELNDVLDETERKTERFADTSKINRDITEQSTIEAHKFAQALKEIAENARTVSENLGLVNKQQERMIELQKDLEATHEAAALAMESEEKNPIKRAEEEFNTKQQFAKRERDEADKAAAEKYKATETAANDAQAKSDAQKATAEAAQKTRDDMEKHVKDAAANEKDAEEKIKKEEETQKKREAQLKEKGYSDQDIDWMRDMASKGHSAAEIADLMENKGGFKAHNVEGDKVTHYQSPTTGIDYRGGSFEMQGPASKGILGNYGDLVSSLLGGEKGLASSIQTQQMLEKLKAESAKIQADLDVSLGDAKDNYADAAKKAEALAKEAANLKQALSEMSDSMSDESKKRNQEGQTKTVENLKSFRSELEKKIKEIESDVTKRSKEGAQIPSSEISEYKKLTQAVAELNKQISSFITSPPATSSFTPAGAPAPQGPGAEPTFQFTDTRTRAQEQHDKYLAALGDANTADYSWGPLFEAYKKQHDAWQKAINDLKTQVGQLQVQVTAN